MLAKKLAPSAWPPLAVRLARVRVKLAQGEATAGAATRDAAPAGTAAASGSTAATAMAEASTARRGQPKEN